MSIESLKNFPCLYEIFSSKEWNSKGHERQVNHPLMKALLESEDQKYIESHRALLKSLLQILNNNFCTVINYLKNRNGGSTKIKNYQGSVMDYDQFYEVVAEVTWLAKWISKGIPTVIEPLRRGGPDAKLSINGKDVFCEVTALNISEGIRTLFGFEKKIVENISEITPKYHILITTCRKLTDDDVKNLSEFIKKEIARNNGKNHFQSCYNNDIHHLVFVDNPSHYVEIHYSPSLEQIPSPKIGISDILSKKIREKIRQLNKDKDNVKVLVLEYGRRFDGHGLDYWNIDSSIKPILGKTVFLNKNIFKFSSLPLKDLSALIVVSHTLDRNYPPSCYINDCADFIINENEVSAVACI